MNGSLRSEDADAPEASEAMLSPAKEDSQRSIQSVEIGFKLIRCLEAAPGPLTLKEISASAGMPPSKAHLYLVSFRRIGLVAQEGDSGRYALGPYAIQLGLSAMRKLDVIALSRDKLQELRDASGESVYLAVWGNLGPCIVSKCDGNRPIPMIIQVGYVLPVLTTATGRIFLAYLPPEKSGRVIALEEERSDGKLKFDGGTLEAIVAETRSRGLARTDSLLYSGFTALSAPVFAHDGAIVAALSLLGPSGLTDVSYNGANARLLRDAAADLSKQLGW